MKENLAKAQVEPTFSDIFTMDKYKLGTEVCLMLAIFFYGSGVPVIPIVSNAIFSKTTVATVVAV